MLLSVLVLRLHVYFNCTHNLDNVGSSWMKKGPPPAQFSTTRSIPTKAKVEADHPDSPSPRLKPLSLEDKDTNVLMIKFGALSNHAKCTLVIPLSAPIVSVQRY